MHASRIDDRLAALLPVHQLPDDAVSGYIFADSVGFGMKQQMPFRSDNVEISSGFADRAVTENGMYAVVFLQINRTADKPPISSGAVEYRMAHEDDQPIRRRRSVRLGHIRLLQL